MNRYHNKYCFNNIQDRIINDSTLLIQFVTTILILSLIYSSGCLNDHVKKVEKLIINEIYLNRVNPSISSFRTDDKSWLEIYNPNDYSINLLDYRLYYSGVRESPYLPNVEIKEYGYIIICKNIQIFNQNFNVPKVVDVYEYDSAFDSEAYAITHNLKEGKIDYIRVNIDIPKDHSVARYKNGFDTDNDVNDFYFDPNPTPGRENNMIPP